MADLPHFDPVCDVDLMEVVRSSRELAVRCPKCKAPPGELCRSVRHDGRPEDPVCLEEK